jgi:hypothetical protein
LCEFSTDRCNRPFKPNGRIHFFTRWGQLRITLSGVADESETGW